MQTTPFIAGKHVYLRALTKADLPAVLPWTSNRTVTRYLFRGAFPATIDELTDAFEATAKSPHDVELAVCDDATDRLIGITGLHSIHWVARSCEFRILIGEPSFWRKGLGTESCQCMAAYAFELLNMHKLWLGVTNKNVGALRSYEKVGFAKEGVLRDEVFRNGQYYDVVRMSMLQNEYERLKPTWPIADLIDTQFPSS
jgi:[ribosomal protein S5]-alanine N-acetyltransferase